MNAIPLRRVRQDYPAPAFRARPSDHLIRAILAEALAHFDYNLPGAIKIASRLWPDDAATSLVLRAATTPLTLHIDVNRPQCGATDWEVQSEWPP